jgi:malonyl-CoA/methylmalonyl-CoA synthetase
VKNLKITCGKLQNEVKMGETAPRSQDAPRFPNDPILVTLLGSAQRTPSSEVIIKDFMGFEKTYPQLLSDVLETRDQLKSLLPASNFTENGLLREENVYITALTRTGYEYAVAFFAVRALGGAYVPLGSPGPDHEKKKKD